MRKVKFCRKPLYDEVNMLFSRKDFEDYMIPFIEKDIEFFLNCDSLTIYGNKSIYTLGVIKKKEYFWYIESNDKSYHVISFENSIERILNIILENEKIDNDDIKLEDIIERRIPDDYISFYELLGLLKNNIFPVEVSLTINNKEVLYKFNGETDYIIVNRKKIDQNFNFFLSDSISDMGKLRKNIKIVNREKTRPTIMCQ